MTIGKNIKRLRELSGLTQEELGKQVGVSSMAVSQWENDRAVPRMGTIEKLAQVLKTTKSSLIDDGETAFARPLPGAITPTKSKPAYLPLLGRVHAGEPCEPDTLDDLVALPAQVADAHPRAYFLKVEGDCMDKIYPEGCLILVDPDREPANGSIAAVSIDGHDAVMRRMLRTPSTMVLAPESHNPDHADIVVTAESGHTVELHGTVVWFQAAKELE